MRKKRYRFFLIATLRQCLFTAEVPQLWSDVSSRPEKPKKMWDGPNLVVGLLVNTGLLCRPMVYGIRPASTVRPRTHTVQQPEPGRPQCAVKQQQPWLSWAHFAELLLACSHSELGMSWKFILSQQLSKDLGFQNKQAGQQQMMQIYCRAPSCCFFNTVSLESHINTFFHSKCQNILFCLSCKYECKLAKLTTKWQLLTK